MFKLKVPLGFGIFALLFSLVVGSISGVSMGVLLFRAFLSGVIFALVGLGAQFLIKRYIPELAEMMASGDHQAPGNEVGENVDITLPDENPHQQENQVAGSAGRDGEALLTKNKEDTAVNESPGRQAGKQPDSKRQDKEEVRGSLENTNSESFVEEVEELSVVEQPADFKERQSSADLVGTLDTSKTIEGLPDIESFTDSFQTVVENQEDEHKATKVSITEGGADVLGHQESPAALAKAVQTILKKDQKG